MPVTATMDSAAGAPPRTRIDLARAGAPSPHPETAGGTRAGR